MLELPEVRTICKDLKKEILGKTIRDVGGNFTDHKFTFYHGDPNKYKSYLINKKISNIIERNYCVEIEIKDYVLTMRDGANIRYYDNKQELPSKSKLLLVFDDNPCINVTTSMYSAISVFKKDEEINDKYYNLELAGVGVMDKDFTFEYFKSLINKDTTNISLKAFLATEQRILGIGNGSSTRHTI